MRKVLVGIEIDGAMVKIVALRQECHKWYVDKMIQIACPKYGEVAEEERIMILTKTIADALVQAEIEGKEICFLTGCKGTFMQTMQLESIAEGKVKEALYTQLAGASDGAFDAYQLAVRVVGQQEGGSQNYWEVVVAGIPKQEVEMLSTLAKKLKKQLLSIQTPPMGVMGLWEHMRHKEKGALVIHIGETHTSLTILVDGISRLEHHCRFGRDVLKEAVANHFHTQDKQLVAVFLQQYGAVYLGEGVQAQDYRGHYVSLLLLPILEQQLMPEIGRILAQYSIAYEDFVLERVYLSGEGSVLGGLQAYIADYLQAPVYLGEELLRAAVDEKEIVGVSVPSFLPLVGAIKGALGEEPMNLWDKTPEKEKPSRGRGILKWG